jgi:hypothetical protein
MTSHLPQTFPIICFFDMRQPRRDASERARLRGHAPPKARNFRGKNLPKVLTYFGISRLWTWRSWLIIATCRLTHDRSRLRRTANSRMIRDWQHFSDMAGLVGDVRCWGQSGRHVLSASISPFDPCRTSGLSGPYRHLQVRKSAGRVLACFDAQWPDLKLAVACFGGVRSKAAPRRRDLPDRPK